MKNSSNETKIASSSIKDEKTELSQKLKETSPVDASQKRKLLLVFSSDSTKVQVQEPASTTATKIHNCVICKKQVYAYACQPCGHLCLCETCCSEYVNKKCPVCSKNTLWVQRIFLPHPLK